jgi:hypothetical protein
MYFYPLNKSTQIEKCLSRLRALALLKAEIKFNKQYSGAPVAHACNPSYSGGRNQEDCSLKPAQQSSASKTLSRKNPSRKGLMEWLKM